MSDMNEAPKNEDVTLSVKEAEIVAGLRSGDKAFVTQAILSALGEFLAPLVPDPEPREPEAPAPTPSRQPHVYKHDPTISPYEHNIATSIVSYLAMNQYLESDFAESADSLIEHIADRISEGLRRYDWPGSLKEAIHYANVGRPRGWKSVDLADESEDE